MMKTSEPESRSRSIPAISGGIAGLSVDCILYPLDTVKTRLQSSAGFYASGGFKHIYSGIGSNVVGSVPSGALFFIAYDGFLNLLTANYVNPVAASMVAASIGEITACSVRVPMEVVKQRAQVGRGASIDTLKRTLRSEGIRGLYRGYWTTVMREIPFSCIQFPLWETLKDQVRVRQGKKEINSMEAMGCGAIAGGISAFLTNPLDVSKTRIMLARKDDPLSQGKLLDALKTIYRQNGMTGLFSGVIPRVTWISIGGAIFLGEYEILCNTLSSFWSTR